MANGNLTPEETIKVSRSSIKQLIKKYNASNGLDKTTLQLIIEQLAKTPLFFAVQKGTADKKAEGAVPGGTNSLSFARARALQLNCCDSS